MKTTETVGPVLIHIITQKGKGYAPAETASDKMHGVGPYNPKDGKSISKPSSKPKVRTAAAVTTVTADTIVRCSWSLQPLQVLPATAAILGSHCWELVMREHDSVLLLQPLLSLLDCICTEPKL